MSFPDYERDQDCSYNNADSFAMSFDESWNRLISEPNQAKISREEKTKIVLKEIQNHPFAKDNPAKANEIAIFRIKLLNLS